MQPSDSDRLLQSPETASTAKSPLLTAALAGLLALSVSACGDDKKATDDGDDKEPVADAGNTDDDDKSDAGAKPEPEADAGGKDEADAGPTGPVVTKETEGNRTYASLKEDCAKLGGYVQVHAACAGTNSCQGFSYGDWDPGVLTEHTCAGVNGCNGISCVVLPEDSGKTGKEIYEAELPAGGPGACTNCHGVWGEDGPDLTKFKVYVLPGSTRTVDNWLDLPQATQEAIVAFGKSGVLDDGTPISNMVGYHKLYSKAEVQRVVEYIRTTLTAEVHEYKVADPEAP